MRRIYFLIIAMVIHGGLMAQSSSLIFFTEEGEKFILFINGDQKNETPETRVTVEGVNTDFAQVKVQFETAGAPVLKQQMMIDPGMEMTSIIKKNKKGRYVFRPVSSVPITSKPDTETVRIEEVAAPEKPVETVTTVTTTTTTSGVSVETAQNNEDNASIGVNISDGENSMNLNVNVGITGNEIGPAVTEETTTTTTTTSYTEPGTQSPEPVECSSMGSSDYERAKKSISSKSFADEKMTVLKQVLKANCVSVNQVVGFIELFTFEENKLDVAKAAYPKTTDKGNYYQVNDALTYSESVEDLNRFLESQ